MIPQGTRLQSADFHFLAQAILDHCGQTLREEQEMALEARLYSFMRTEGIEDISELMEQLRSPGNLSLLGRAVQTMTNGETLFFRDVRLFEALKTTIFPEVLERFPNHHPLRIWSAACASGQEVYSVAILLAEHFAQERADRFELLASDFAYNRLQKAQEGLYSQLEVNRGLPARLLIKYFSQQDDSWLLGESIRQRVRFREINLAKPWPLLPKMHIVLLRNVLIYFDDGARQKILDYAYKQLLPGGYLILGGAESSAARDERFESARLNVGGCFVRKP